MNTKKHIIPGLSALALGLGLLTQSANGFAGALHVVRIENNAAQTIQEVYASPPGRPWGPDRLGSSEVIIPGYSLSLDLDDGSGSCRADVKAVFRNGRQRTHYNVDICDITRWIIHDISSDRFTYASF